MNPAEKSFCLSGSPINKSNLCAKGLPIVLNSLRERMIKKLSAIVNTVKNLNTFLSKINGE